MIREIRQDDAHQVVSIYNFYIENSSSTFEETCIDSLEMSRRIKSIAIDKNHPFLVYEEDDQILGYAYASTFRERISYRFTVESSVYLHPEHYKKGIGLKLYTALMRSIKAKGFHSIIGVITLPNENSIRLHEHLGFKKVGHLHQAGWKFNQWHDVGFWELSPII